MSKRTALYIRASSRDQIQHGFSIPDQLARLRAEAHAAGSCAMPILSAEAVEQAVITAVFTDVAQRDGAHLHEQVNASRSAARWRSLRRCGSPKRSSPPSCSSGTRRSPP